MANKNSSTSSSATIVRPPVIVIMGHIDHGKSTLLDYIRKSNIVGAEAGGITQHTGSYEVIHDTPEGDEKKITFIDTPGHAAFQAMRERGAGAADIAILIVSAEEGVKAQTLEALKAITDAGIPYIIAITKIDKPNANVDKVRQDLASHNIYVEGYGGDIPCVPISSKTGVGIPDLLDMILLVAELGEYKAHPGICASGIVIESSLDPKSGASGTLLIREGTLGQGDYIIVGDEATPVRSLMDFSGKKIKSATVCAPVQIMGFKNPPSVGAVFHACLSKKEAEMVAKDSAKLDAVERRVIPTEADVVVLPIILKADMLGTGEAIQSELNKLSTDKVVIKILQAGVGTVSETDMQVAESSVNPIVLGFNVRVDSRAKAVAQKTGIEPRIFSVIYELTDNVKDEIKKRTPKVTVETILGKAKILKVFNASKGGQIIGGVVTDGTICEGGQFKLIREDTEVSRGTITGLEQNRIKAREITTDTQFGAMIDCKQTVQEGDYLDAFDTIIA